MSGAICSAFGKCLSSFDVTSNTNEYFKKANYWMGMGDDGIGKLGQHTAGMGRHIAQLTGNKEAEEKCGNVEGGFATFRDAIGATRFIPCYQKWITGQAIWQTDSSGWRKVVHEEDGKPKLIPHEDLNVYWRPITQADGSRIWKNRRTNETSADGKYIDNPQGDYVMRDWKDIVMDVLVVVARTLSPFNWLHSLKAMDLGQHAKGMSGAATAIWGTVLTMGFVSAMSDLINEADVEQVKKKIWEAVQAFLDLVAIPFDFGVGSANPILGIVGKGFNVASAACLLVKEGIYY